MSKNFELLRQVEKAEQEAVSNAVGSGVRMAPDFPKIRPGNGFNHRLTARPGSREEVVRLVHRTFLHNRQNSSRVVVFASVDQGDGCSSICACAAEVLAEQGVGSSCVVDANFRTPSLHHFWHLENQRGIADALKESGPISSFAQRAPTHNLWVLTCGNVGSESHTLLNDEQMRLRMTELRKTFDNVLVDVPPANLYPDALTVGRLADGVVLILQSAATRRQAASKAKDSFAEAHVQLLGAVLNKRAYPIPRALYERL